MRSTAAFLFWIAWAFYSLVVDAEVNLVRNGDFSTAAAEKLGSSTWVYDTPEAWTATGASVIIHKDDAAWAEFSPPQATTSSACKARVAHISNHFVSIGWGLRTLTLRVQQARLRQSIPVRRNVEW